MSFMCSKIDVLTEAMEGRQNIQNTVISIRDNSFPDAMVPLFTAGYRVHQSMAFQ